jgi:glycosyltransferase involved in cell wall biosynthesis
VHIVLLNTEFQMNGAALLLHRWARHLVASGHRVTAVHATGAAGPLHARYLADGIELADKFDVTRDMVAICNTVMAAPYVLKIAPVAPIIWWIHEGEISLPLVIGNPDSIQAFTRARAVIFPSASIRDRVFRSFLLGVPDQRMHVVPPGIDPVEPADRTEAQRRPGPVQVISIGTIYPRKRQADLIRALARLADLPVECVLVGQVVELEQEAQDIARKNPDRFRFSGQVDHAIAMRLLARADIFALPSSSECLPIAPLEAGLRGKPVVLSDLVAHEGVWRHGLNCLMHPVHDVDLLAHMIRILATDQALRLRLGRAARRVASGFRNDLFLNRLDMVLASIR